MDFKYIVHYRYGEIDGKAGCHTPNQAKEIAEVISLLVEMTTNLKAEISIKDVKTGDVVPFLY